MLPNNQDIMDSTSAPLGSLLKSFSHPRRPAPQGMDPSISAAHVSAPNDPTLHSMVERRNAVMEKMIDVAVSKGDLNFECDLHMYCAATTATCNLEYVYNGHTMLEYLIGEIPCTCNAFASPQDVPPLLGPLDSSFLAQLSTLLVE